MRCIRCHLVSVDSIEYPHQQHPKRNNREYSLKFFLMSPSVLYNKEVRILAKNVASEAFSRIGDHIRIAIARLGGCT